jgi:hypothetical protein
MASNFLEILSQLHDHHVDFVIGGGVAASLHANAREPREPCEPHRYLPAGTGRTSARSIPGAGSTFATAISKYSIEPSISLSQ